MTTSLTIPSRRFILFLIFGILLAIFPVLVSDETWDRFGEWFFSWIPAHPPAGLESLFGLIVMPFFMLRGFGYMIGTAIFFWCAGRYCLRLPKPVISPALLVPLLCDAYVFAQALPFLAVPRGAEIRPMGWAFFSVLLALGMTVFGLIYVSAQLRTQQGRVFCGIGFFLSILPIPIVMSSLRLMAAIKGFELEP
jgi:hypothetical protein